MAHIIINDTTAVDQYNATAGQAVFTVSYPFFTEQSLKVYLTPAGQSPDDATDILAASAYTVVGAGIVEGALKTITLVSPAALNDTITIQRDEPAIRTTDLQDNGDFLAETHNNEQDRFVMLMQQLSEIVGRGIGRGVTGGNWDAQNIPIGNLAQPVADDDAARKIDVDTIAGASAAAVQAAIDAESSRSSAASQASLAFQFKGNAETAATSATADAQTAQTAALALAGAFSINIKTTDITLALTDAGTDIIYDQPVFKNVTIPAESTVNFPDGTVISFLNKGNGPIRINRSSLVSLKVFNGVDAPLNDDWELGVGGVASIKKIGTNEWVIFGNAGLVVQ